MCQIPDTLSVGIVGAAELQHHEEWTNRGKKVKKGELI